MNLFDKVKIFLFSRKAKIAIALIAVAIVVYFISRTPAREIETAKVVQGTYEEVLLADGVTPVNEKFSIFSPVSGVLRRIQKNVGDAVFKGEVIAIIDWDIGRKIRSPINGKILKIYRESEGPVSMEEKLLDIGDTKQMSLVVKILSEDMSNLDVGDRVEISGFSEEIIQGKVSKIEPSAITEISSLGVEEQKVPVWIEFPIPNSMGEGYKLEAKILLFEEEDSLLIPSSSLIRKGDEWNVFVVSKNRARKRSITVVNQSEGLAKVQSGLKINEEVILYPSEEIKDGTKIKIE